MKTMHKATTRASLISNSEVFHRIAFKRSVLTDRSNSRCEIRRYVDTLFELFSGCLMLRIFFGSAG